MELYIQEQTQHTDIYCVQDKKCIGFDRFDETQIVGSIYVAKVEKVVKALNAAFLVLEGENRAYLPITECVGYLQLPKNERTYASISSFVHEGEWVLVQVEKEAAGEKLPKVTQNVEYKATNLLYKPYEFMCAISKKVSIKKKREILDNVQQFELKQDGVLFRSSCESIPFEQLKEELQEIREIANEHIKSVSFCKKAGLLYKEENAALYIWQKYSVAKIQHIYIETGDTYRQLKKMYGEEVVSFSMQPIEIPEEIQNQVDQALKREVFLSNGGSIVIEQTEAFTVIDVNSKKSVRKRQYDATVKETNRMAAKEIAAQIQLRNISGSILIDFISMKSNDDKEEIRRTIIDALKNDPIPHRIFQFTELGILEMTRKRKEKTLRELLCEPCSHCGGNGVVKKSSI